MKSYILLGIILWLAQVFLSGCHNNTTNKALEAIKEVPSFKIISIDSSQILDSKEIPQGRPLIFVYFDPDCAHCNKETEAIMAHFTSLRRTRLYFLTNGDQIQTKEFYKRYRFDTTVNISLWRDYNYSFFGKFLPPGVPYIVVYDSERKLLKLYNGETDINEICAILKQS